MSRGVFRNSYISTAAVQILMVVANTQMRILKTVYLKAWCLDAWMLKDWNGQEGYGQEGYGQEGYGQEGYGQEGSHGPCQQPSMVKPRLSADALSEAVAAA
jgi:hypothetical protein